MLISLDRHVAYSPPLLVLVLVLSAMHGPVWGSTLDVDYGGVPLWINRFLGEPSVLSLRGRMDPSWFRAVNTQSCPSECECPVQWPTALYCDHRALGELPAGLPARTQYLFLQGNQLTGFRPDAFANATGLRWLFLDRNQLLSGRLDAGLFSGLTRLVNVFMNNNNLTEVPMGLPAGVRQLRLAYNHIEKIPPGTFENLRNLTTLLLQGNRLKVVGESDFKGLSSLSLLDLSGNLFETFPRHLPPSVSQLYLSNNSLVGVEGGILQGLPGLRYLRLGRNMLRDAGMEPEAFNLSSLVELELSYNQLTRIPVVPTTLQYLYLEANQISVFNVSSLCREVSITAYSRIKILRLDGNKLRPHELPADWAMCLRVLHHIYI
ncbi:fibromodulin [Alosa pseudoharengus]|uniref:fibromodulin n=1 Tax=Alosa pseudoharengus TaxID=34774 RepID=UPI003F8B470E